MNAATGPGTARPICVGLLWHSVNSDNLGVTALTASNVALVEEAARAAGCRVRFIVMGWRDPGQPQFEAPNVSVYPMVGKSIVDPRGLFAKARECDLVLDISTGDAFADIYGAKRFRFNIMSKLAVLASRRPLILSPQTIGPFQRGWARSAARLLMGRARAVISRDDLSADYARSLGISNVVQSTDVAFRLPFVRSATSGTGVVRAGINVSGLLFNGGYTGANMFDLKSDYASLARMLVANLQAQPGCEVHLVSHVISERFVVEDDYRIAQKLAEEFPGTIVAPRFRNSSEAKSYISGLDFFCGSRMHACIAAFSSGVPVVPVAYSRKFAGLFGSLGYDKVADCKTESMAAILDKVMAGYAARHELKKEVERGLAEAERRIGVYLDILQAELKKRCEKLPR